MPARARPFDVRVVLGTRVDGDFRRDVPLDQLEPTRRALIDLPWSQPLEPHGADVLVVTRPGEHDGANVDALVTDLADAVLAVWAGDCAPVALVSSSGAIGAVHAGWRGIEAGVLEAAVGAVRALGPLDAAAGEVRAELGPCIHPCCYEFGGADLARLSRHLGPAVVGTTRDGRPALDVPAAVRAALARVDVVLDDRSECTGCGADRWYSHRVRGERGRHVMAVWRVSP